MQKLGLTDADGKTHKEKIMNLIGDSVPKESMVELKVAMEDCLAEEGNVP